MKAMKAMKATHFLQRELKLQVTGATTITIILKPDTETVPQVLPGPSHLSEH